MFKKMKDAVTEQINSANGSIQEQMSNIDEKLSLVGYKVTTIEISASLPPRISFEIDILNSSIQEEVKKEVLSDSSAILRAIITTLDYAFSMANTISFKDKILSSVIIEGALIPSLKLVYKSIEEKE